MHYLTLSPSATVLLQNALNAAPTSMVVYQARLNEAESPTDWQLTLVNTAAETRFGPVADELNALHIHRQRAERQAQFSQVLQTGSSLQEDVWITRAASGDSTLLTMSAGRLDENSVVVTYADSNPHQNRMLQTIADNIEAGLLVNEAIRDETGQIVDFRYLITNQYNAQRAGLTPDAMIGRRVGDLFPGWQASDLFRRFVTVVETGETQRSVFAYEAYGWTGWYDGTFVKTDDGVFYTYVDVTALKEAELAQEQQADLLRSILDGSQNQIMAFETVRDAAGKVVDFRYLLQNEVNRRLLNLTDDQVIGQTMLSVSPGLKTTDVLERYIRVVETGEPDRFELPYFYQGQLNYYDVSAVKRGDGLVITLQNKTAEHQARLQQREMADTFMAVLNSMPDGLNVLEIIRDDAGLLQDMRYQYLSSTIYSDTGLTPDQMIGQSMRTLFPGVIESRFWQGFEAVLTTGEPQRFEVHYTQDGYDNTLLCQVTQLDADRLITTYQIVNDIKRAEQAQEQQARLLQTVIDTSPAGIILYKAIRTSAPEESATITDFRVELANSAGAQIVGRQPTADFIGRLMSDLLPSAEGREFFRTVAQVVEIGQSRVWLMPYFADGINGWFNMSLIRQGSDEVVVTFLDVTNLVQLQEQLEYRNFELQRSNESLQSFAYIASHDLQEPLRKIQAFSDLIRSQYTEGLHPEAAELFSRMQVAAERMSLLMKDLLTYSRISNQQRVLQSVSLMNLLHELMDDLSVIIQETGACIHLDELPAITGEETQLRQLFQNLLSNALKFCNPALPPDVRVQCQRVACQDLPATLLATTGPGLGPAYWAISVVDNGIGFDEKYLDRIFQVFQRLHGRTEYMGSGIGLAIVRKVAENHRGFVTASSQPGQGSTFTVYLPV